MKMILAGTMLVFAHLISCGTAADDTTKNASNSQEPTNATTTEVLADNTLATEDVASQATEAIDASVSFESDSVTGLALADGGGDDGIEEKRTCTEAQSTSADKITVVSIARDRSASRSVTSKAGASRSIELDLAEQITRNWSKTDSTGKAVLVPCNKKLTYIAVKAEEMEGMKLAATFNRDYSLLTTISKGDATTVINRSNSAKGTRSVSWKKAEVSGTQVTLTEEVSFDISKSETHLDKDGKDKTSDSTIKTDGVLTIKHTRNKSTADWISREISGKTLAARADGGKIELTYDKALFTKDSECDASSGIISGKIFAANSTDAAATFSIDLSAAEKIVTFSDGKTSSFDVSGCDLARPTQQNVSASTGTKSTTTNSKTARKAIKTAVKSSAKGS